MSRKLRCGVLAVALAAAGLLAGCAGGGSTPGGTVPLGSSNVASQPVSPSSAVVATLSGVVADLPYDGTSRAPGYSVLPNGKSEPAGAPIGGAAVYVGPQILTGTTPPASVPAGFAATTTAADGTFRVTTAPAGNVAVTIFAPAPYTAILHRDVTLVHGTPTAETYELTRPTAAESAWLATLNETRADFGVPATSIDEAALESARYWTDFMRRNDYFAHCIPASACVAGQTIAAPATYGPQDVDPTHRFYYEHGFSGASMGENIAADFPTWQLANQAFMAEQSLCPNDSADNCPFDETTGHFLNIVNPSYSWAGFGIDPPATGPSYYDQEFAEVWTTRPHITSDVRRQNFAPGLRP